MVINLALHDHPRYSLRDEPGAVKSLGMTYVHIPVLFEAPTEYGLQAFFAAMQQHQHEKVLIHCAANIRATAFLGLHGAIIQRRPVEEAFAPRKAIWAPTPRGHPSFPACSRNIGSSLPLQGRGETGTGSVFQGFASGRAKFPRGPPAEASGYGACGRGVR